MKAGVVTVDRQQIIISAVLQVILEPSVLEFLTSSRYLGNWLSNFKLSLESKSDKDLELMQKVCDAISFNVPYVDLRNKPFVNLIYKINDQLNILARKNLRGQTGVEKEDIDNEIKNLLGNQTKELRGYFFELFNLFSTSPGIFLQIYQNSNNLYYLSSLFREFAYPPLESKSVSVSSASPAGRGIFAPKPLRCTTSISRLDYLLASFNS
jgi:hypothetical protein